MTAEAAPATLAVGTTVTVQASPSTAGFVTSMPPDMKPSTRFKVARYQPAYCAELGGVRGHGLERRQIKNARARTADNPDGLFWEYTIKLTAPCPVVLDDDEHTVLRAEVGWTIAVVLDEHIESIEPYFESREWCAEMAFVPFVKKKAPKKIDVVYGFKVGVSEKPMLRSEVVGAKK